MSVVLDRAVRALEDPKNWVKLQGFGDGNCLCLAGHLAAAGGMRVGARLERTPETNEAKLAVVEAIKRRFPGRCRTIDGMADELETVIWKFNDHPDTTHADVLAVAQEAKAALDKVAVPA